MCGIEVAELLERHFGQLGGTLEVDVRWCGDLDEIGLIGNIFEHDAVSGRIGNDVLHRLQLGNIVGGFGRHAQAFVVARLALARVAFHRS